MSVLELVFSLLRCGLINTKVHPVLSILWIIQPILTLKDHFRRMAICRNKRAIAFLKSKFV